MKNESVEEGKIMKKEDLIHLLCHRRRKKGSQELKPNTRTGSGNRWGLGRRGRFMPDNAGTAPGESPRTNYWVRGVGNTNV